MVRLRREDAARLGYDNAVAWRSLMREKRNDIAAHMKIKPENLKWYAVFHDEGIHPHIHFIAYSTDPKEAYLTKNGIDGIRSRLAREIFQQDLLKIYSEQTVRRDTLNRESLSVMREMCERMQNGVCDNPQIGMPMQTLADKLSKTGGKKQYGYLKADAAVRASRGIMPLSYTKNPPRRKTYTHHTNSPKMLRDGIGCTQDLEKKRPVNISKPPLRAFRAWRPTAAMIDSRTGSARCSATELEQNRMWNRRGYILRHPLGLATRTLSTLWRK